MENSLKKPQSNTSRFKFIIGLSLIEARKKLAETEPDMRIRIKVIDKVAQIGDCMFDTNRINVEISNDKIIRIMGTG